MGAKMSSCTSDTFYVAEAVAESEIDAVISYQNINVIGWGSYS